MSRALPLLCLTLIALLLVPQTHAQQSLDGWPDWVRESMQDEAKKLKFRTVKTPDGDIRTKLPGKSKTPMHNEGVWYFVTDIDAGSLIECYLYTMAQDLAMLTDYMANANVDAVAAQYGSIGTRQIYFLGGGEVAGVPFLAMEWLYSMQNEDQTLVGFSKVRAAAKGELAYVCAHNNIGYRDTLTRVFEEFVSNAEAPDPTDPPYYEEIANVEIDGMSGLSGGVAYVSYTRDDQGYVRAYVAESSLTPVDRATVSTSDSFSVTFTTASGEIVNAMNISVENGEITSDMTLERNDEGNWVSSGTLQGKDIAVALPGDVEPASELQQISMARELFRGDATSVSAKLWMPSFDPTQFLDTTMTRDDADIERQAILSLGPLSYTGHFDEDGNMYDATLAIGPVTVDIERIWSSGSISE
ncbi:MAG: hypothetical protein QNJ14_16160 [Woeseiaceae bacterium]|nr:hypothetical protein [Woeseiaceae bacterium]